MTLFIYILKAFRNCFLQRDVKAEIFLLFCLSLRCSPQDFNLPGYIQRKTSYKETEEMYYLRMRKKSAKK